MPHASSFTVAMARMYATPFMILCMLGLFHANCCHGMDATTEDWILQRLVELTKKESVQDSLIHDLQQRDKNKDTTITALQRDLQQQTLLSNQNKAETDLLRDQVEHVTQHQADLEKQVVKLQQQLTESQHEDADLQQMVFDLENRLVQSNLDTNKLFQLFHGERMISPFAASTSKYADESASKTDQSQESRARKPLETKYRIKSTNSRVEPVATRSYVEQAPGHNRAEQAAVYAHGDDVHTREQAMSNLSMTTVSGRVVRGRRLLVDGTDPVSTIPVAFHVLADVKHIATVDANLVLPTVKVNVGDAYRPEHGLFTAPVAGLYLFSLTITAYYEEESRMVTAIILKNGETIGAATARGENDDHDQGCITVVTQLQAGDEVWARIRCCDGNQYQGFQLTSFAGVLLHQM